MNVQSKKPTRSDVLPKKRYQDYRADLCTDFNNSCGYCDDSDLFTDKSCFHIDHFAPKKHFPALETDYSNLVYSCRFCNNKKRDRWIGNDPKVPNDGDSGFIDPCDPEYSEHLTRNNNGTISAKTTLGEYMVTHLNLSLLRHSVLWNARRSRNLRDQIKPLIDKYRDAGLPKSETYCSLLDRYYDLTEEIDKYELNANAG